MKKTYRLVNEEVVKGVSLPVFIYNLNFHLTDIHIYEDGMIDCWELVDYEGFLQKVKSGWITTSIPDGAMIYAFPLGNIETDKFYPNRTEEDLIKEVRGILDGFKGKKTVEQSCLDAFNAYVKNPTAENKDNLRVAFELVPQHNRRFLLGDMDVDDVPIRAAIYGEKVFKESYKAKVNEALVRDFYLKGVKI